MSPKEVEIVDGYNALFALARLEHDGSDSYRFDVERRYFLETLERKTRKERIVVFDNPEGDFQLERKGHLWILFAGSGRTADELILEMLTGKTTKSLRLLVDSHHRKVTVITNDRELREKIEAIRPDVRLLGTGSLN